jgi:hypothetical protein
MIIKMREMFPQGITPPEMAYFLADAYNTICYNLKPLKTEFLLNNVSKFSSHFTGNTLHLRYKDQPVSAV